MSVTNAMELAVKAKPGMNSREVTTAIKAAIRKCAASDPKARAPVDYAEVTRVSALLTQSFQRGKLDRKRIGSDLRYYPNDKTGRDQRNGARVAKPSQQPARAPSQPKAAKPAEPLRELPAPLKPSAEQHKAMSAIFKKPAKATAARAETVDEFQRRGGRIEYLAPGVSGLARNAANADDDNTL